MLDDPAEIGVADVLAEVEAELSELDGKLGGEAFGADAVNDADIVLGNLPGFARVGNVFAEMGEDGADVLVSESVGGGDGAFDGFTGHEAGDGAADKRSSRSAFAEPHVLRCRQENAARNAHSRRGLRLCIQAALILDRLRGECNGEQSARRRFRVGSCRRRKRR